MIGIGDELTKHNAHTGKTPTCPHESEKLFFPDTATIRRPHTSGKFDSETVYFKIRYLEGEKINPQRIR